MLIDKELIERCTRNERKAQFEMYKKCYGVLMGICLRYEKNKEDAEALLNMGFLKVITHLDKYTVNVPFEAWIRRIMINTIIDEYRKNKKENETIEYTDFEDYNYNRSAEYNTADVSYNAEELLNMINNLPQMTAKVFNLHVIEGFSHQEISDMYAISVGTSKWHVANARKILQERLLEKVKIPKQSVIA